MKKILFISQLGHKSASGYLGGPIYKDLFIEDGFYVKFGSLVSTYIELFANYLVKSFGLSYIPGFNLIISILQKPVIKCKEFYFLSIAKKFDTICLLKVYSDQFVSKLKNKTDAKLIIYFGDAVWRLNPDFFKVWMKADKVLTDNQFTAEYVKKYNKNINIIPDYPQIDEFDLKRAETKGNKQIVTLGWVGSPSTLYNLFKIWEPLENLFSKFPDLHLRLVGTGLKKSFLPDFENVKYSVLPFYNSEQMIEEVLKMDIGLFPLQQIERSVLRGILKASIYMSGGAAVIASPVGQVKEFIVDGVNGLLANTETEWEEKLELLVSNKELRDQISQNGLNVVRNNFSRKQCYMKLVSALRDN